MKAGEKVGKGGWGAMGFVQDRTEMVCSVPFVRLPIIYIFV